MAAGPPYATDRRTLERTCEAEFFTGPGPGGQHRNRSRTGVRLRHGPSGLTVTATERRSRQRNLEAAYARMAHRLEGLNRVPKKRRPTRPTKASRRRRLENKRRRSQLKKRRQSPTGHD